MRRALSLLVLLCWLTGCGEPTAERALRVYDPRALPRTHAGNGTLLKLPSFPQASTKLLDQYALAFAKVLGHADKLPRAQP